MIEWQAKIKLWHTIRRRPDLTFAAKLVAEALLDHLNLKTRRCDPSRERIMECCSMGRTTVTEALALLQAHGIIRYTRGGGSRRNSYLFAGLEPELEKIEGAEIRPGTQSGPVEGAEIRPGPKSGRAEIRSRGGRNPAPNLRKNLSPSDKSSGEGAPAHLPARGGSQLSNPSTVDGIADPSQDEPGEFAVQVRPAEAKPKRPRRAETTWPDELAMGAAERSYAEEHGFRGGAGARLWAKFENHARAKGLRYADWHAAWRNWVLKELEFAERGAGRPTRGGFRSRPPPI